MGLLLIYLYFNVKLCNVGLRKFNGINLNSFKNKYGAFIDEVFNIYDLINDGYLVLKDDYLMIDKKYMYISNEIIVRMFK